MKEVLYEESFNPTNLRFQKIIYVVYAVFFWIFVALDVFAALFLSPVVFVLSLLSTVCFWIARKKIYYCVDLIFVSGQTRIIKVINYRFRRKILIFDAKDVVAVGKIGSRTFERIASTPKIKKVYATPNKYIENGFYVNVKKDDANYLVMLECKEEYLVNLVGFAGRKIIEKDYK